MEDKLRQLTAIPTLSRNRISARAVFFGREVRTTRLPQPGLDLRAHVIEAALGLPFRIHLHAIEISWSPRGWGLPRLVVIPRTRQDAADQRDSQQDEDSAEPGGAKNIEKL